ncbi:DUF885 family protein [Chitinophaga sp.]|uniref:DUF885 family protein n=1 Tax=Chitinophaga sp. TaxID=1869181 RepID=UPI0026180044|nr:DUF885 family protein [uncultured Chitinophaga sp.]
MKHFFSCCLLTFAVSASAQRPDTDLYAQTSEVNNIMVQYDADRGILQRFYAVRNSPERRRRLERLQDDYLQRLSALDWERLPVGSRVDYVLFRRNLLQERQVLEQEKKEFEDVKRYFPFADSLYAAEARRRRGLTPDARALASAWNQAGKDLLRQQSLLGKDSSLSPALAQRGAGIARGLQQAIKSTYDFYAGFDPQFSWWMPAPHRRLDSLLNSYANAFQQIAKRNPTQQDDGSGIIGNPIGREAIIRQLQLEMIPYTPEELIEIANKEFAWCEKEMLKASRDMGFGDNWKGAMEKVKGTSVEPGWQPEAMLELYNQSVAFLKQHQLISLPPLAEETWRMNMLSPERQLVAPFFLGGEELLIAFPTNTMSHDDKMMSIRGNNPHYSRAVVHHELLAGHGLQQFMNDRYKAYRRFDTPFWTEGWALYWERLLWDKGFPRSAEDRVGMLFWRMHRCARILFSLSYHTHKWTPQQCIDFLVDRVNHERANAEGEVRRSFTGGYGPLYQVAYMIGGLQFEALKKELVDSGKMNIRDFHDAIIRENAMPVEMVRAILLDRLPAKDFRTSWRFYPL